MTDQDMTDDSKQAYREGQEAGRDIGRSAGDCPYAIGAAQSQRDTWLKGFGDTRPEVSPASNPDHAKGQFQPAPPSSQQTPHEG